MRPQTIATTVTMAVLLTVGCGEFDISGPSTVDVRLKNDTTEAIVTVRVTVTPAAPDELPPSPVTLGPERVRTLRTHTWRDAFEAKVGDALAIDVEATTLGQTGDLTLNLETESSTLELIHDFDVATADRVLRWRWAP